MCGLIKIRPQSHKYHKEFQNDYVSSLIEKNYFTQELERTILIQGTLNKKLIFIMINRYLSCLLKYIHVLR